MTNRRAVIGIGAMLASGGVGLSPASSAPTTLPWQPKFDNKDAWMDRPETRHRLLFDTTTADAAGLAMSYATNFYLANRSGYALGPETLGVILVFRHFSTPFGYADAMWAKYGATIADTLKLRGEQAIRAGRLNPLLSAPAPVARTRPNAGHPESSAPAAKPVTPVTLASLAALGVRFAVCATATEGLAGQLAKATGSDATAIGTELRANLIPGAVLVPAGIVAVNRAQERGYALAAVTG